jgi:hypothetical protein
MIGYHGQVVRCQRVSNRVRMADGRVKSIEEVKAGDMVLSLNLTTNKLESKQVVKTFVREAEYLHSLTIGSETLYTTAGHPFLTEKGYVDAEELGVGTSLVTRAGPGTLSNSSLSSLVGTSPTWGGASVSGNLRYNPEQVFFGQRGSSGYTVYNFEVEDNHNYFVGKTNGGICVHNADEDYVDYPGAKKDLRTKNYNARVRKKRMDELRTAAPKDASGRCICPSCNKAIEIGKESPEHSPTVVEHWNSGGNNMSQRERLAAFNQNAKSLHCIDCQKVQGGQIKTTFTQKTGPKYSHPRFRSKPLVNENPSGD